MNNILNLARTVQHVSASRQHFLLKRPASDSPIASRAACRTEGGLLGNLLQGGVLLNKNESQRAQLEAAVVRRDWPPIHHRLLRPVQHVNLHALVLVHLRLLAAILLSLARKPVESKRSLPGMQRSGGGVQFIQR